MKRLLQFSLMLLAFACLFSACSDDDNDDDGTTVISESSLPQTARNFIKVHFPTETVTLAKEVAVATPILKSKYFVYLTNAYEIDFNADGDWVEVEVEGRGELPTSVLALVPAGCTEYVAVQYPTAKIESVKKYFLGSELRYELDLNNDLDLIFDAEGQLLKTDS